MYCKTKYFIKKKLIKLREIYVFICSFIHPVNIRRISPKIRYYLISFDLENFIITKKIRKFI